jgi:hypothetical protein
MKAKELAQLLELVVRKVVREELKPILSEVKKSQKPIIREVKSKKVRVEKDPLDINLSEILAEASERKTEKKTFMKNPMLNDMLNEVADSGEWRTLNHTEFSSNQAQSFMQGGSTSVAPITDIDGRPVDTNNQEVANVMGAITKDYSQLMKAIDKKRGR